MLRIPEQKIEAPVEMRSGGVFVPPQGLKAEFSGPLFGTAEAMP
jgi:hypothetical protein